MTPKKLGRPNRSPCHLVSLGDPRDYSTLSVIGKPTRDHSAT